MHDDGISILGQIARDPHLKLLQRKSYYVSPGPESGGDFVAEESTKWSAFPPAASLLDGPVSRNLQLFLCDKIAP